MADLTISWLQSTAPVRVVVESEYSYPGGKPGVEVWAWARLVPHSGVKNTYIFKKTEQGNWSKNSPQVGTGTSVAAIAGLKDFVGEYTHLVTMAEEGQGLRREWYAIATGEDGTLEFTSLPDAPALCPIPIGLSEDEAGRISIKWKRGTLNDILPGLA